MARTTEVGNDPKEYVIPEIGVHTGVEPVEGTALKLKQRVEMEAFMNEIVKIRIMDTAEEGKNMVILPQVNAINQPIVRGQWVPVRRKYVEILARNKTTRFKQETPNPSEIDRKIMRAISALVDPFEIRDPNPKGTEWLDRILAEER